MFPIRPLGARRREPEGVSMRLRRSIAASRRRRFCGPIQLHPHLEAGKPPSDRWVALHTRRGHVRGRPAPPPPHDCPPLASSEQVIAPPPRARIPRKWGDPAAGETRLRKDINTVRHEICYTTGTWAYYAVPGADLRRSCYTLIDIRAGRPVMKVA